MSHLRPTPRWVGIGLLAGLSVLPWNIPSRLATIIPQVPKQAPPADLRAAGVRPQFSRRVDSAGDDPFAQRKPATEPQFTERQSLLESLLESGDFRAAVAHYEAIYDTRPLSASEPHRQSLVTHAGNLLLSGEAAAGVELLETYLNIFYRDPDALVTLGRAYRSLGNYPASIKAFQRARQYSHLSTMRDLIGDQLNWVVSQYSYRLRDEGRAREIAEIYIRLMRVEPDNPYYALGLAKAYVESARYDDAVRALSPVLHDAFVGKRAQQLLRRIQTRRDGS